MNDVNKNKILEDYIEWTVFSAPTTGFSYYRFYLIKKQIFNSQ